MEIVKKTLLQKYNKIVIFATMFRHLEKSYSALLFFTFIRKSEIAIKAKYANT